MASLETTYMGIPLRSPLVVAASPISGMVERIEKVEATGAGALVIRSIFEEQIAKANVPVQTNFEDVNDYYTDQSSNHDAPKDHMYWIEKTRTAVKMPLIGSLNAVSPGSWVSFARDLESTGVDALELNVYSVEANSERTALDVEKQLYDIVQQVKAEVKIPLSVKLSPFYTSLANVAMNLSNQGADGLVLFNRFLQPDIDIRDQSLFSNMTLSHDFEMLLPLRWTALLYGRTDAEIALSTGVQRGRDAVKALLAGAQVVQVATTVLKHGISYLNTMHDEILEWMDSKGYASIEDFRGKVSQQNIDDPHAFERAQYVKLLLKQR